MNAVLPKSVALTLALFGFTAAVSAEKFEFRKENSNSCGHVQGEISQPRPGDLQKTHANRKDALKDAAD
jgi:hypothetical protein